MSLFQGILAARILLLATLAGLFLSLALGLTISRKIRGLMFAVVVAAVLSFPNFGVLHPNQSGYRAGHIHYYDAFHYFMGAKYLPELGYYGLYEATLVAGRDIGAFSSITAIRDLRSYQARATSSIHADAVRARFSNERWKMFTQDLRFFGPRIDAWPELLADRGYNDPPPRGLLLHLLVTRLPANLVTLSLVTSLDYVVLVAAFAVIWRVFGEVPAALTLAFFSLNCFARFDFIGGSLLRWDWIAALLCSVGAFARGSGAAAGILLGYATIARIFPVLFLIPLIFKWVQSRVGQTPDATVASCLRSAVGVILLAGVSLAAFDDQRSLVVDFASKMRLHNQDPFINSLGLGPLLVFGTSPWSWSPEGSVFVAAQAMEAARRPASYLVPLISAGYLMVAVPLILRTRSLESLMYAVPLVYCALSLTGYYYSFLALLVLLPWRRGDAVSRISLVGMALLSSTMAATYAFEVASPEIMPLFYQASIQMGIFFLVWIAFEYVRLGIREGRN